MITSDSDNHHWAIYLVDGTTGTTVYHTRVNAIGPIHAALSENWLVYTYFGDNLANATDSAKGHQVVTVELYEGAARDDKTNRLVLLRSKNKQQSLNATRQPRGFEFHV